MRKLYTIIITLIVLISLGVGIYIGGPWIFGSIVVQLPDQYRPLTEKYALAAGVDPCFMAAIIQAESRWNPNARSYVGASGLGQLMPGTAASVARLYKVEYNPSQITNPEKNLQLASLLTYYNLSHYGSVRNALVAYNAGGGRVRLSDSNLPRETQRYIRTVSTYYSVYRSAYPDFCKGSGNGLSGSAPATIAPGEDFPDFPQVETNGEANININELWKTFLGI